MAGDDSARAAVRRRLHLVGLAGWLRRTAGLTGSLSGDDPANAYRRRAVRLLLALFVVDYADRSVLSAVAPALQGRFGLSDTQIGVLAAAFGLVGGVVTLPVGVLTDRVRRTTLLAVSAAVWTVAMGFTGAAVSFGSLLAARMFLAAVSSATGPALPSLVGDLVPPDERGRVLGVVESGQLLGGALGVGAGAVAVAALSWRWGFWALTLPGALLAVSLRRLPEPERGGADEPHPASGDGHVRGPAVAPELAAIVHEPAERLSLWRAARYALRIRTNALSVLAVSVGSYFLAGTSAFAVIFAVRQYRVSTALADTALLGLGLGALAGILAGGRLGDALLRRGRLRARLWVAAAGYLLCPVVVLPALLVHTLGAALPFLVVGMALLAMTMPSLDAVRLDVVAAGLRGRMEAVRTALRTIAEASAPAVFGVLADHLGGGARGLQVTFLLTLPLLAVAGVVTAFAVRSYPGDAAAAEVSAVIAADPPTVPAP